MLKSRLRPKMGLKSQKIEVSTSVEGVGFPHIPQLTLSMYVLTIKFEPGPVNPPSEQVSLFGPKMVIFS